jgi:hypothetical protein
MDGLGGEEDGGGGGGGGLDIWDCELVVGDTMNA